MLRTLNILSHSTCSTPLPGGYYCPCFADEVNEVKCGIDIPTWVCLIRDQKKIRENMKEFNFHPLLKSVGEEIIYQPFSLT